MRSSGSPSAQRGLRRLQPDQPKRPRSSATWKFVSESALRSVTPDGLGPLLSARRGLASQLVWQGRGLAKAGSVLRAQTFKRSCTWTSSGSKLAKTPTTSNDQRATHNLNLHSPGEESCDGARSGRGQARHQPSALGLKGTRSQLLTPGVRLGQSSSSQKGGQNRDQCDAENSLCCL